MTRGIGAGIASAAALAVLALGLAACETSGYSGPAPPATETAEGEYRIGPGDRLRITVWKNPELSGEVPVRPDGQISVPLADDVQAQGLTTLELKTLLTKALSEYVANPDVTVVVVSVGSKRASVIGAVRSPGPVNLATELRVLDAIAAVGGFGAFASKDDIRIIRRTANGDVEYRFDYDAYVAGKAPGTNILLAPGDTIVVPD